MWKRGFLNVVIVWLAFSAAYSAEPQANSLQDRLQEIFVHRVFILRNFYRGSDLHFDVSGNLLNDAQQGGGPVDGGIHVRKLKLERNMLTIEGDNPIPIYSVSDEKFIWNEGHWKRRLRIDASAMTDEQSALKLLFRILYKPWEYMMPVCGQTEQARFRKMAANATISAKRNEGPAAKSIDQIPRVCFPTGEIGYSTCCGVVAAKELHAPDPSYTPLALRKRVHGRVSLAFIVDADGHPTTLTVVSRPLGAGLELAALDAVRKWKFRPATFAGRPVPVAVMAEIEFHH